MNIKQSIINLIEANRISSTEVADALGKSGVIQGVQPINPNSHITGEVHYIYAYNESNWPIHEQIQEVPENCFLYVDTFNCKDKAIFGDLVSKYLMLYKKVKGIVVQGKMRDIPDLKKFNFSIWCKGYSPLGCYNRNITPSSKVVKDAEIKAKEINGGIMVCDDSGCTLIKKELINEETLSKLELIELQEDIWGYCINTLKWNTYETICLKKYLSNPEVLPEVLREKVKSIPFND